MAPRGRAAAWLCAAQLLRLGALAQEPTVATAPQETPDVSVTLSPPDVISDTESAPPAPPVPPPAMGASAAPPKGKPEPPAKPPAILAAASVPPQAVSTAQAPPTEEVRPVVSTAQAPPTAEKMPAVPVAQAPPTEKGRLPRRLPKRRGPSEEEMKKSNQGIARSRLKRALEGLNYNNPSDSFHDEEPPHRRLREVRDAANDDDLTEEERQQAVQALHGKLTTDFEHHRHIDASSNLFQFAAALDVAHSHKTKMDQAHMARVMQKFNGRVREQLEAAIEGRDLEFLREVSDVVHHISFPRYWPGGDEGDRQAEEYVAWKQELLVVLELEERRKETLDSLDEAIESASVPRLREAFKFCEEHCHPEDLVAPRALLEEREAWLAKVVADLEAAVSAIRDADPVRPPTAEEYYGLRDLFEKAVKEYQLQANDMEAWDEARRWLRIGLWRLGEG